MNNIINISLFILFFSNYTYAQPQACQFGLNASVEHIKKIVLDMHNDENALKDDGLSFPNTVPLNTELNLEFSADESLNSDDSHKIINYEAILRPQKNYSINLLNLIIFKLNRDKNLMYVCLNYDSNKLEEAHLTIYFLSVAGLNTKPKKKNIVSNFFSAFTDLNNTPSADDKIAKLTRIPIELFALHLITQEITNWLQEVPYIGKVFKVPGAALKFSGNLISKFTGSIGAGVERIDITQKEMIFSNFVSSKNSENTHVIYRLNLEEHGISIF